MMAQILEILEKCNCRTPLDNGEWLRTNAFYRDNSGSYNLSINKSTGLCHDFATGKTYSLTEVLRLANVKIDLKDLDKITTDKSESDDVVFEDLKVGVIIGNDILNHLTIFDFPKYHDFKMVLPYFKGGLIKTGKFYNRYTFPIFEDDKIIGLAGRKVENDTPRPKWLIYGPKNTFKYPLFLNKDLILIKNEVYLVESIGDVLALFSAGIYNVLAVFGLTLSPAITSFLIKNNVNKIIVSVNGDERGREGAKKIKKTLSSFFAADKISECFPPAPYKDWAETPLNKIKNTIK